MAGTVGFIGLGNMGRPMALNLVKRGFSLVVHDIDPTKVTPLRDRGAKVVASPEQVAAAAERTIVMVETTAQAESVIAGERGIVKSAPRGHIVICMSTIDPFALRRLAEQLAAGGVATLDAPVSGGTERAGSGELSIIAGSDPATFEACRDLFAPGGTVDITYKDQELETAFAKQLGVPLLLANLTQQLYQMARAAGLNKEDGLAVIKVLERLAGVQVKG